MARVTVEKVSNGYIVTGTHVSHVYETLDRVFDHLLLACEGRCPEFQGEKYGCAIIKRDDPRRARQAREDAA